MKQKKMANFQVIGAYNRMQTIPWEEENRLFDGVPYDIDLSQDSPGIYLNEIPIKDLPTKDIVESINFKKGAGAYDRDCYDPMGEDYFVVEFRKLEERERNWRKEKKKQKDADTNFGMNIFHFWVWGGSQMIRQVTENINKISCLYSHLGYRVLSGDVEAAKWFYVNAWREIPPLIRTLSTLQECLTASEIKEDTEGIYCDEFLYYWGMINIGEVSDLIFRDLGTAEFCFKKIERIVPKAESRLAFIKLLKTDEQRKSDSNMARLEVLRYWGTKQDFFSMIALAKIIFQGFLEEDHSDNGELPIRLCRLLALPCQNGHPVAICFWNEVIDYINPPAGMYMRIDESRMDGDVLYDFYV